MPDIDEVNNDCPIDNLNKKCFMRIFSFLSINERIKVQRVCRRWKFLSKESMEDIKTLDQRHSWSYLDKSKVHLDYYRLKQVLQLCGRYLLHLDLSLSQEYIGTDRDFVQLDLYSDVKLFKLLKKTCPALEILDIRGLDYLSPEAVTYLANEYNDYSELRISNVEFDCQKALSLLLRKVRRLRSFQIYSFPLVDPQPLADLPAKTLEKIYLCNVDDDAFPYACSGIKNCSRLTTFHAMSILEEENINEILEILAAKARFEDLSIDSKKPIEIKHIGNMKNLRALNLKIEAGLNDEHLAAIGENCQCLTSLTLTGFDNLTDEGFMALKNLQHLTLTSVKQITGKFFNNMMDLKTVEIDDCRNVNTTGLQILLDSAERLELLTLTKCSKNFDKESLIDHAKNVTKDRDNRVVLKIRVNKTVYSM